MRVIDGIAAERRPQRTANTKKTDRDRFWNEVLEIWAGIGGAETGIAAATFLIAVSDPVFRTVSFHGHKTVSSTPQHCKFGGQLAVAARQDPAGRNLLKRRRFSGCVLEPVLNWRIPKQIIA